MALFKQSKTIRSFAQDFEPNDVGSTKFVVHPQFLPHLDTVTQEVVEDYKHEPNASPYEIIPHPIRDTAPGGEMYGYWW